MNPIEEIKDKMTLTAFKLRTPEEVFAEVRSVGTLLVTRDGEPACIMLSPEEYNMIKDELFIKEQELQLASDGRLIDDLRSIDDEMELLNE